MQGVAALIHAHHERHDGKGFPDGRSGHDIPLGARILAVADVYDAVQCGLLVDTVATSAEARAMIRHARGAQFDPEVVEVFLHITEPVLVKATELRLSTAQLTPGMVLAADLLSSRGLLMLTKGRAISGPLIQRIREFETHEGGQLNLLIRPGTGETREAPLPT
jgi:hypothetical protein